MIHIENTPGTLIFLILLALGALVFLLVVAARYFSRPRPVKSHSRPSSNLPGAFDITTPLPFSSHSASPPPDLETGAVFVRTGFKTPLTQMQQNAWDKLPPRQKEAAVLVASGLSNRQVAVKMHIQISTVQSYLKETYAALNVRSRTELVNFVRDISLETSSPPH